MGSFAVTFCMASWVPAMPMADGTQISMIFLRHLWSINISVHLENLRSLKSLDFGDFCMYLTVSNFAYNILSLIQLR